MKPVHLWFAFVLLLGACTAGEQVEDAQFAQLRVAGAKLNHQVKEGKLRSLNMSDYKLVALLDDDENVIEYMKLYETRKLMPVPEYAEHAMIIRKDHEFFMFTSEHERPQAFLIANQHGALWTREWLINYGEEWDINPIQGIVYGTYKLKFNELVELLKKQSLENDLIKSVG